MHWTMTLLTVLALFAPVTMLGCESHDQQEDGSATKEMHEEGSMTDEKKPDEGSGTRY